MDLDDVDAETLLSGRTDWLDDAHAEALAAYPLDAVETEYPHFVREVESPEGPTRPRETHPVFFGCYDWHSAVHSHWALVRALRLFDEHPRRAEIVDSVDSRLTDENVAREVAYLEENPGFEKPYGWAWLLHLAAELSLWDDDRGRAWRETLAPLERLVVERVEADFLTQDRPFRVGTHGNTAFALHCVLDYARTVGNEDLAAGVCRTAREHFEADRDYPVAYEPLGWDFLSPALVEADLMRRVLDPGDFREWVDGFVPDLTSEPHATLLEPARVDADPEEDVALHLVGLNLSKAWALAGVAESLGDHVYAGPCRDAAARHATRGVAQAFTDDYAGAHWLSSFVLYFLTRHEAGIGPT